MPPLRSNPEVILAGTQEEFDEQFAAFKRGEMSYLRVGEMDDGRKFDLFIPSQSDYNLAVAGLMLDGVTRKPVHPEYFGDAAIGGIEAVKGETQEQGQIQSAGVRKIRVRQAAGRVRQLLSETQTAEEAQNDEIHKSRVKRFIGNFKQLLNRLEDNGN